VNGENTYHYLKAFYKELGDNIHLLLDEVKNDKIPEGVILWERPVRIKNGYLRLGYNKESGDFHLSGTNSDRVPAHITL
jgi:hypothetical protein